MGVPAFFRWLSRKYPSIVVHCVEEKGRVIDGVSIPVDTSTPNPNNIEFDNLYLDMNGIIHPCCHPENKPAPKNEDEMMVMIFEYIDRLFSIVRPRRLLYMAIDGVAPRAKMNQQRSRRFRASKDSKELRDEVAKLKDVLRSRGMDVPPDKAADDHFDSNCITPGTEFMFRLADSLRYYIHHRLNTDPGWANISVILSDANVPGEGEHKIMDFIRRQRAQPDHDPNTHHCLCGADADLIMLGLATHETNFTIIREEFKPNKPPSCHLCGQTGHEMKDCEGLAKEKQGEFDELPASLDSEQDFIFLRLNVLREYLYRDLTMSNLPFAQDIERAIDDWVLMCFFVGNDFLPHLPSLEIREGAIDKLITLYKKAVYKTGGYLTDSGIVNLSRVQLILTDLGEMEDEIFKNRRETELEFRRRDKEKRKRMKRMSDGPQWQLGGQYAPRALGSSSRGAAPISNPHQTAHDMRQESMRRSTGQIQTNNYEAAAALKSMLTSPGGSGGGATKRKADDDDDEPEPVDEVKLWEDGWKDRYYESKFGVGAEDKEFRRKVANEYVLGICWVLKYYYQGCASWDWYFPYHYAPFASDFVAIGDLNTDFEPGTNPFRPLEQLMSVFPAASKKFLPRTWQDLMDSPDSPIIDFYPVDFKVDLNGKKFAWQGVALLPFVDEVRLQETLKGVYPNLTEFEKVRNVRGPDRLFVGPKHPVHSFLAELYKYEDVNADRVEIDPKFTHGMRGSVWCDKLVVPIGAAIKSPVPLLKDYPDNQAICVCSEDPTFEAGYIFQARLLKGAKIPEATLKPEDFEARNRGQQYRPQTGFNRNSGYQDRMNASSAIRHVRAGLGAGQGQYSTMPPTGQPRLPPHNYRPHNSMGGYQADGRRSGGNMQGHQSMPPRQPQSMPLPWQRNLSSQRDAYQQNQQRGYGHSSAPSYQSGRHGDSRPYGASGYGPARGQRDPYSAQEIEMYSTAAGRQGNQYSNQGAQGGRQPPRSSYPYPPRRY